MQISKGPIGTKGSRVTTYVSLPGRYLVFMPTVEHIGVSRRIPRDEERARLKEIMKRARRPGSATSCGRSAKVKEEEELRPTSSSYVLWQDVLTKRDQQPAPSLLHSDLSLSFAWSGISSAVESILLIDSREEYNAIKGFVQRFSPEQTSRIHFMTRKKACSDYLGWSRKSPAR